MTDPIPPPSRFAEEPEWTTPAEHRRRVISDLLPHATARERPLLLSAAERRYFHECTAPEQAAIRAIGSRIAGLPTGP